jgi:hypothetical protein
MIVYFWSNSAHVCDIENRPMVHRCGIQWGEIRRMQFNSWFVCLLFFIFWDEVCLFVSVEPAACNF